MEITISNWAKDKANVGYRESIVSDRLNGSFKIQQKRGQLYRKAAAATSAVKYQLWTIYSPQTWTHMSTWSVTPARGSPTLIRGSFLPLSHHSSKNAGGSVDLPPEATSKPRSRPGVVGMPLQPLSVAPAAPLCWPLMRVLLMTCCFPSHTPHASAELTHLSQHEPLLGWQKTTRGPSVSSLWGPRTGNLLSDWLLKLSGLKFTKG